MSPAITRKRFIAGAVCPACSEQDKIQMWEEDGVPHRECGLRLRRHAQRPGSVDPEGAGYAGQPERAEAGQPEGAVGAVLPQSQAEEEARRLTARRRPAAMAVGRVRCDTVFIYSISPGSPHERSLPRAVAVPPATLNRFAPTHSEAFDDGWEQDVPPIQLTEVREEIARTVISRNQSPDLPFDRSINPYRGCEHGCIYCYARPSHAYWDLSPGIDFETRLIAKSNVASALEQELSKPGYRCAPINLGANTDPYQPLERERRLTRQVLEVLLRFRHPLTIVTRAR